MSLRSHFTSIDMHLLGWVGGRYGCHGGALVRIMGWQWGDIRAAWCKRLHMSGYVYSRHDTIKSSPVWCSLHIRDSESPYLCFFEACKAGEDPGIEEGPDLANYTVPRCAGVSKSRPDFRCGRRVGACMRDADAWTWTLILVRGPWCFKVVKQTSCANAKIID
jgi:hypothetical protein